MRKTLLVLSLIILTVLFSSFYFRGRTINHIDTSYPIDPYLNRLHDIVKENDLEVDWRKIETITIVPLRKDILGYWNADSKGILINSYFVFPRFIPLTEQEKDDYILLTLAHEIGHAQGLPHCHKDTMNLMNPSAIFDVKAIRGMGAEQYIINCYKNELGKK